jgi:hypothetical protein
MKKLLVVLGACGLLAYRGAPAHADYALYSWSNSGDTYENYTGAPWGPYPPGRIAPDGNETRTTSGTRGPNSLTLHQKYAANTFGNGYVINGIGFQSHSSSTWASQGTPVDFAENLQQAVFGTASISGTAQEQLALAEVVELVATGPSTSLATGTNRGEWNRYSQAATDLGRSFGKWIDLGTINLTKSTSTPTAGASFVSFSNSSLTNTGGRSLNPSLIEAQIDILSSAQITMP